MKTVPIQYSSRKNQYFYTCPYCGKKIYSQGGDWDNCNHVLFGYEDINARPLTIDLNLKDKIQTILLSKRMNFIENLYETWNTEFKPQERHADDPDTWDEAKYEAISIEVIFLCKLRFSPNQYVFDCVVFGKLSR